MVDFHAVQNLGSRIRRELRIIIQQPGVGRQRNQVLDLHRNGVEHTYRNYVVRKRIADHRAIRHPLRGGVVDGVLKDGTAQRIDRELAPRKSRAEIAISHRHCGNGKRSPGNHLPVDIRFQIEKEKRLVFAVVDPRDDYRTAQCAAEIVLLVAEGE